MFAFMYMAWFVSVLAFAPMTLGAGEPVPVPKQLGLEFPVMNAAEGAKTVFDTTDYPTGVFVFEVFFNTCPACNDNAHNVHALSKAYETDEQVHVMDLSTDSDDEDFNEWLTKYHTPAGHLLKDEKHKFIKDEAVRYVPTVIVKDCKLTTVYRYTGIWTTKVKDQLTQAIEDAKVACTPKGDK